LEVVRSIKEIRSIVDLRCAVYGGTTGSQNRENASQTPVSFHFKKSISPPKNEFGMITAMKCEHTSHTTKYELKNETIMRDTTARDV
jgi:hypothetical protein